MTLFFHKIGNGMYSTSSKRVVHSHHSHIPISSAFLFMAPVILKLLSGLLFVRKKIEKKWFTNVSPPLPAAVRSSSGRETRTVRWKAPLDGQTSCLPRPRSSVARNRTRSRCALRGEHRESAECGVGPEHEEASGGQWSRATGSGGTEVRARTPEPRVGGEEDRARRDKQRDDGRCW